MILLIKLTPAELYQLQTYVTWAEESGVYHSPKKYWDKRHEKIKEVLKMAHDKGAQE